jgi:hypothetical protein
MSQDLASPGKYLHELIEQESRAVAKRRNAAGYIGMWPDAVRKVLEKFPNLSPIEKETLRGTVQAQIQMFCMRTRRDIGQFSGALGSVVRILGGASC